MLIKVYEHPNKSDHKVYFGISRMEDIHDKRGGVKDDPHRHDFYTLILTKSAKGTHTIDFEEYVLSEKQIFFVSPGQVHQVIEKEKSYGYSIVFSDDFLVQNNIPTSFLESIKLFSCYEDNSPLAYTDMQKDLLWRYAEEMIKWLEKESPLKWSAIASNLQLLLIECQEICPPRQAPADFSNHFLSDFKDLIEKHYKSWHQVGEYSQEMGVSSDHLNRVLKSVTGKTAKEFIQSKIIVEAKRLLYFTDLSTKEIAYELGFSESSNFSQFFKKYVGVSPSEFS